MKRATPTRDRQPWTIDDAPDQSGRTVVVTGSNTGIGYETASALAGRGAHVVLAVRDDERGRAAATRMRARHPRAAVSVQRLDLSSLASIRAAAEQIAADHPQVSVLVNNAGVAHSPRAFTEDGLERIFGTNHLGHFALTGLLLPSLLDTPGSRVVTVSALAHRQVEDIDFDDLRRVDDYDPWTVYGESKLANLLFTRELTGRLSGTNTIAVAAHPGLARSDLSRNASRRERALFRVLAPILQTTAMGALPTCRAATDPTLGGGEFLGPRRRGIRGAPVVEEPGVAARDDRTARRLWSISEALTDVVYPV
ncbi:SDR family NAD(P)-dependent oxidoreductase [Rhodococcus sp. BP-241]|uniref:oxidoreductase n=1 Tax=Rhodococcus sp. BP-241 TaxID=2739441 RepID=UPI001C9B84C3|nr:oxidoreductase [Rhodococcus sp. BP-241]MBY6708644.1 SDR family NAD(P)-dependent oxidoreductase [Rhodococcus sp. BP-241]